MFHPTLNKAQWVAEYRKLFPHIGLYDALQEYNRQYPSGKHQCLKCGHFIGNNPVTLFHDTNQYSVMHRRTEEKNLCRNCFNDMPGAEFKAIFTFANLPQTDAKVHPAVNVVNDDELNRYLDSRNARNYEEEREALL